MRRHLTLSLLAACVITLAATHAPVGKTQSKTPHPSSQKRTVTEFVSSPSMPIDLSSIVAVTDAEQTALTYAATDRTGGTLTGFDVIALVVDKAGSVRGGEVWRVSDASRVAGGDNLIHPMKAIVRDGDRLLLSVWRVSSESGTHELDKTQIDNVFRSRAGSKSQAGVMKTTKVRYGVVTRTEAAPYCIGWYEYAESKCSCGVKSFSCTESNGSVSWTCYTKAESPGCKTEELMNE